MFLRIKPAGKYQYVEIVETYRDPETKISRTNVIEKIGRLDKILEEDPEIIEKLKKRIEKLNQDAEEKRNIDRRKSVEQFLSEGKKREISGYPVRNYGYVVYKHIWDEMKMDSILGKEQQQNSKSNYDLAKITFLLTISRLLNPASKLRTYQERGNYLGQNFELDLNQIYRTLDLLSNGKDEIEKSMDRRIQKRYGRELDVAFYDVTTYAFQSVEADSLKRFGYSKDQKVNEVQIVMGLFIDNNGIPMGYELFPGNTSDFSTLKTALNQLKEKYKIKKIIITADRGLNSKNNLKIIKDMGFGYIMAYKIRGASAGVKKAILSPDDYLFINDQFKYKTYPYRNCIKDGKEVQILDENLIITWSDDRQKKDAADRKRLLEKAVKLAESPARYHAELKKGGKKYLTAAVSGMDLEVNYAQAELDAQFDGYYAIETSETLLDPADVIQKYKGLWKIEESFRVMKSELEARPCFVWTESRIRGHFVICFIALVIQRILEYLLSKHGCNASTAKIIAAIRSAEVMVYSENSKLIFLKRENELLYDEIIQTLGLKPLFSYNEKNDIRRILALHI